MAKKTAGDAPREVRVLVDCWAGRAGTVVALPPIDVARLVSEGQGDDTPEAIIAGKV